LLRVGLTGGLATGKSFVGRTLAELGCYWISADELGHRVLEPGGAAYDAVVSEFGRAILDEGGRIDRRKLAAEVFGDPEKLERLNRIVHPLVIEWEEKLLSEYGARHPEGIGVVEAAILIETGSHKRFDRLIVTVCDPEQQIERAMRRTGLSRDEVLARIRRQLPVEEKIKLADYVIDTSGTKEETVRQVKRVYEELRSIVR